MSDDDDAPAWVVELQRRQTEQQARLTVGTRVVVDLGECPHVAGWHGTIEQGKTGRIMGTYDVGLHHPPEGHRYLVWFDQPIRQRRMWFYAAHELESIPWSTPEKDGELSWPF